MTIQNAIDAIVSAIPEAPYPDTVDVFKTGDPSHKLTGIVTTFLTNYGVVERAAQLGANLIITHEPTFYDHRDKTDWLKGNTVYQAKRQLIDAHQIAIWRFHDYLHTLQPDPTVMGLLQELEWEGYAHPEMPGLCQIPPMPLLEVVGSFKEKLGLGPVRFIGDPEMTCRGVALAVGSPGPEWQIKILEEESVDVLVTGEINEWNTSEYTRDALLLGQKKALVVIGHAASEEAGMRWIIPWLQSRLPGIPITFVPVNSPFKWA
ncbi:MAG: Nif3-like dinuclear metal center hexameric protein [Omnitrophica WOR_2 bacterium]